MKRHGARLRAVDSETQIDETPQRKSEDASATLQAGWSEVAALAIGPAVGAVVLFAVGAMIYAPGAPGRYWLIVALFFFFAAWWVIEIATHAGIYGPSKVIFGVAWLRERVALHHALAATGLTLVALVAASPSIIAQFRSASAPAPVSRPAAPIAPVAEKAAPAASVPAHEPAPASAAQPQTQTGAKKRRKH